MEQKLITGIISDLIDVCKMAKNSQGWSGSDPDENRWTIFYSLANKTAKTVQEVDIIGALQKIERDKNSLLVACKKARECGYMDHGGWIKCAPKDSDLELWEKIIQAMEAKE